MNSAKKRVVLAITLAEPGGAQTFVLGFAQWLMRNGYEVTVLAGDGDWLHERCKEQRVPIIRLAHMGRAIRPGRDLAAYGEMVDRLRELKPDAIHLNSTKVGVLGSLAAKQVAIRRVVYRIGGWAFLEPLPAMTRRFYRFAERLTATFKDVIICVHPGDVDIATRERIRPREKIIAVPNGIDLQAFDAHLRSRQDVRRVYGLDDATFVFGTIAGLYKTKNISAYLDACAIVHREAPDTRFLVIGDGPERKELETKRRSLRLDDVVLMPGSAAFAPTLLNGFDAFVLPSAKEGMPWSLLEAMAAALPCIATDVGANRWMLEPDAGFIVPSDDPKALADAMRTVLKNREDAERRGSRAREAVRQRFPLEATYVGNARALEK